VLRLKRLQLFDTNSATMCSVDTDTNYSFIQCTLQHAFGKTCSPCAGGGGLETHAIFIRKFQQILKHGQERHCAYALTLSHSRRVSGVVTNWNFI